MAVESIASALGGCCPVSQVVWLCCAAVPTVGSVAGLRKCVFFCEGSCTILATS